VSGGDDGTIRVWDAALGKELVTLYGHTGSVASVSWSPDGARLASFSAADGTSKIWDPASGKELLTFKRGVKGSFTWCVAWSPDSRCLAAPFLNSFALFDASNGYRFAASRAALPE
jgi:WD40 repeat protein